ncbi:MAG: BamA/TamA family outer membrane protein [candidate division KSB1 bacterium]|nr:BamA/TamA family outer membrane protein [candidate division KSB1 bacterium]MDZ7365600.1 BamA/TamA family outer membrane protein [candidate division KSB1 bacterium]MDZ7403324.1 BamA/TamA family outer membrane protein [candidate division KSB1 bacterium]
MGFAPSFLNGQTWPDSSHVKIIWKARGDVTEGDLRQLDGLGKNRAVRSNEFETLIHRVLSRLQQRGFYLAQIDSVTINSKTATVHLDSQSKVRVAAAVNVVDSVSAFSLVNWQRELDGTYDETNLRQRLSELLAEFARRGYPLARFRFDSVALARREKGFLATLYLQFNSGPAVRIDSILIRGNKITRHSVLARELPIQRGGLFNFDKVQGIPERLMRLGYLQAVAPPQLAIDAAGRYLLDIAVVEGNSNWLNGVAGYNPGDGSQKGFLTGLIDVKFGNLLGTGRQINARWEKRSRQTQELALRYREPWIAGYPAHLSGGFQQLIQDTTYVERRWDFTMELPLGQNFSAGGHIARESIATDSLAQIRFNLPRSSVSSVGASLRYDSTDDPINPRRGVFYMTTVETGRKNAGHGASRKKFSRDKILVDLHWLLPTFGPHVLSFAVHGRQVTSNAPPEILVTDQFRFGGATTLRGYREEQFRGSRVAWSNLEYRYLLSRRTRAFVFFDAAYYSGFEYTSVSPPRLEAVENSVYAWGFGSRVDTPLGIIGVDYGLGQGDPLTNGKVHISLVNSF